MYDELKKLAEASRVANHDDRGADEAFQEAFHPEVALELIAEIERLKETCIGLDRQNDAIAGDCAELRKDADRYRFIRSDVSSGEQDICIVKKYWGMVQGSDVILELDKADFQIDAAMEKDLGQ